MYVDDVTVNDINFVVAHLCNKAIEELRVKFGNSFRYDTLSYLYNIPFRFFKTIKLKKTGETVGLFGLVPLIDDSAGIFFLSTEKLYEGNMFLFLRETKKQIEIWNSKFEILLDDCYKQNKSVIKWLRILGFKPTADEDKNFQIYQKVKK